MFTISLAFLIDNHDLSVSRQIIREIQSLLFIVIEQNSGHVFEYQENPKLKPKMNVINAKKNTMYLCLKIISRRNKSAGKDLLPVC